MHLLVDLHLSREEYLRWYQGHARMVHARSRDGRSVRFPAQSLQPYVTHSGVSGTFAIYFDENNKLLKVERLTPAPGG